MENLKVLMPGFSKVVDDCDFTQEQIDICEKIGVNPSTKYTITANRDLGKVIGKWIDYPLSLILIDKFLVDERMFKDNFEDGHIDKWGNCADDEHVINSWGLTDEMKKVVTIIQDECKLFETYSLNDIKHKNKKRFNSILFSLIDNENSSKKIKDLTKHDAQKYMNM